MARWHGRFVCLVLAALWQFVLAEQDANDRVKRDCEECSLSTGCIISIVVAAAEGLALIVIVWLFLTNRITRQLPGYPNLLEDDRVGSRPYGDTTPPFRQQVVPSGRTIDISVPEELRLIKAFQEFCAFAQRAEKVTINVNSEDAGKPLVVPCIVSSRMGSDVAACFSAIGLDASARPLLLLLHPRAHHNSDVFPSEEKGAAFVTQCAHIIDAVVWNDQVYDCGQNRKAAGQFCQKVRAM